MSAQKAEKKPLERTTEFTDVMEVPYPQLFGRYLLLRPIMDGGMASISLARHLGQINNVADKLMVIKTIKLEWSKDEKFKAMFLDEIRIVFGLSHPNIVQAYDYGMNNGQLYLAMEYIEGFNVRQFERRLKKQKKWFSLDVAAYIVREICQALDHAHNFKNKLTGEEYQIVHRDVSPDNIMITNDGLVKVIDFGIARAAINSEKTRTGMVKGKSSYMAPEYLQDQSTLTHLSDQFSTGLILWELLTGRKCFNDKKDMNNLMKIIECEILDPREINPKVPAELAEITMRALQKKPSHRYPSMKEMAQALTQYLGHHHPGFGHEKIKRYGQHLFAEEIKKNDMRLRESGNIDISPYLKQLSEQSHTLVETTPAEGLESGHQQYDTNDNEEEIIDFSVSDEHLERIQAKEKKKPIDQKERFKLIARGIPSAPMEKKVLLEKELRRNEKESLYEGGDCLPPEAPDANNSFYQKFLIILGDWDFYRIKRIIKRAFAVLTLVFILFLAQQWFLAPNYGVVGKWLENIGAQDVLPENYKYQRMYEENLERKREESIREQQERIDRLRI